MRKLLSTLFIAATVFAVGAQGLSRQAAEAEAASAWAHHADTITIDLPGLVPVASTEAASWTIPPELEPDATMDFYFGSKGSRPEKGYPLFIYLHGSGPRDSEWATGKAFADWWDDAPSVYFVPRIPREGEYYRWWQKGKQWVWDRLFRQVLAMPDIDPDRIYFVGISEGGYGSQRLASFLADYLAAAGPMAGGEPLVNCPPENCRHIGFSLRTGGNDTGFYRNTLTQRTGEAFDELEKANPGDYRHHVELIPGMGHGIDYTPMTPWLSQFERRSKPLNVTWEDYEMDGLHRRGFYNLEPLAHKGGRRRYDMSIDKANNAIDLQVRTVEYETTEKDPNWGIVLRSKKNYEKASTGAVRIYLTDEMVDLDKPVTITVNGIKLAPQKLERNRETIDRSINLFGDPRRVFTASVDVWL